MILKQEESKKGLVSFQFRCKKKYPFIIQLNQRKNPYKLMEF